MISHFKMAPVTRYRVAAKRAEAEISKSVKMIRKMITEECIAQNVDIPDCFRSRREWELARRGAHRDFKDLVFGLLEKHGLRNEDVADAVRITQATLASWVCTEKGYKEKINYVSLL